MALGFKKGPLEMMQQLGKAGVQKVLEDFEAERPGFPGLNYLERFEELTSYHQYILVDRLDDVVVITIRRPAQMNAITDKVNDEILAVLRQYETDDSVKGFVITGYGPRAFCAGGDIGRFPEMLGDAAAQFARDSSHLLTYMDGMAKPVVAAVNGLVLGGGSELAMRCHELVASSRATFQFPEITLGILPGIGGLIIPFCRWPKGAAKFAAMLCHNDRLSAKDALALGVVSALEDDYWKLVQLAADRARGLSGAMPTDQPSGLSQTDIPEQETAQMNGTPLSTQTCAIILAAVRAGVQEADLGKALEIGYRAFGKIAEGPAAKEGIGAFLGKRKPDFAGMQPGDGGEPKGPRRGASRPRRRPFGAHARSSRGEVRLTLLRSQLLFGRFPAAGGNAQGPAQAAQFFLLLVRQHSELLVHGAQVDGEDLMHECLPLRRQAHLYVPPIFIGAGAPNQTAAFQVVNHHIDTGRAAQDLAGNSALVHWAQGAECLQNGELREADVSGKAGRHLRSQRPRGPAELEEGIEGTSLVGIGGFGRHSH